MAYYFFLDELMLPVPPAKMTVKIHNMNKTTTLIDEGEINIIKTPGLSEISFDIRLPSQSRPYANYDETFAESAGSFISKLLGGPDPFFKPPSYYLDYIEKLKTSNDYFYFSVSRLSPTFQSLFDTSMLVTLEDYSIEEDAKDGFDVTIPVRLKQYREYGTKEVEVKKDENGNETVTIKSQRPSKKSIDKVIKVRNSQSVWEVCKKAGNGSLNWRHIWNLNDLHGNPAKMPTLPKGGNIFLG